MLPPSEGKNKWWTNLQKKLSFEFTEPKFIAQNATEKDLKCSGKRYAEAMKLNQSISWSWEFLPAIERYSGVMYNAISYENLSVSHKNYFADHIVILSGYYGLLRPLDSIANYKLPIDTKWLLAFWKWKLEWMLCDLQVGVIIDLLPWSYKKMINFSKLKQKVIHVDFYEIIEWTKKKHTHSVKKIKGQWLSDIVQENINFWNYVHDIRHFKNNEYELKIIDES